MAELELTSASAVERTRPVERAHVAPTRWFLSQVVLQGALREGSPVPSLVLSLAACVVENEGTRDERLVPTGQHEGLHVAPGEYPALEDALAKLYADALAIAGAVNSERKAL